MLLTSLKKLPCVFIMLAGLVILTSCLYLLYTSDSSRLLLYASNKASVKSKMPVFIEKELLNEQAQRKAVALRQCAQFQLDEVDVSSLPNKTLSSIIVDDTYKVIYCQVPKVACTNWRRIFLVLSGQLNTTNPLDINSDDSHHKYKNKLRYLHQYPMKAIRYRLKHYFKFMITREPLERVLSAYINKFTMKYNGMFQRTYGKKIIKHYRRNATDEEAKMGEDVTFPEFVNYLLDPRTVLEKALNEHWIQQHKLCFPCTFKYDFIGRYESLSRDAEFILQHLNLSETISFPSRASTYSHSKTSDHLLKYFKQIPHKSLEDLYQMYFLDFAIFDYPYSKFLTKLGVSEKQV